MTKTPAQIAAFALSALMTLAIVAGMNRIATAEFVAADHLAMAADGPTDVAIQQLTVVGHRANA